MSEEMKNDEKIVPTYALDIINTNHATEKKRLWILIFVLLALFFGTNVGWIIHESKYEDVVTTVSQNAASDSGDAVINGDRAGGVFYGIESDTGCNDKGAP